MLRLLLVCNSYYLRLLILYDCDRSIFYDDIVPECSITADRYTFFINLRNIQVIGIILLNLNLDFLTDCGISCRIQCYDRIVNLT